MKHIKMERTEEMRGAELSGAGQGGVNFVVGRREGRATRRRPNSRGHSQTFCKSTVGSAGLINVILLLLLCGCIIDPCIFSIFFYTRYNYTQRWVQKNNCPFQ